MIIKFFGSFYFFNCNNELLIELGDLIIIYYVVCFCVNVVGRKGFSVYKSVFYGLVGEVFVYFVRRVNENKDVIKRIELERLFLN